MSDLLTSYSDFPESLLNSASIMPLDFAECPTDGCTFDSSDCVSDTSCSSDKGCSDICYSDGVCVMDACSTDGVIQEPEPPEFEVGDETATSITVYVYTNGDYPYIRIFWRLQSESEATQTSYLHKSSDFEYVIDGLIPGEAYIINVGYYEDTSSSGYLCGAQTAYTLDGLDLWSWTSSNGSASRSQTVAAYSAITSRGPISDFSYLVWNDLCAKIATAREFSGTNAWEQANGTLIPYDDVLMNSSDKVLTADRFNAMRYNLGSNYSTGIGTVYPGDPVFGEYFITITEKLNEWIAQLNGE